MLAKISHNVENFSGSFAKVHSQKVFPTCPLQSLLRASTKDQAKVSSEHRLLRAMGIITLLIVGLLSAGMLLLWFTVRESVIRDRRMYRHIKKLGYSSSG